MAHKTHHCLVDGVGSVDVAYLLLDTEPNAPERPPAPPPLPGNTSVLQPFVPSPPQPIANVAQAGARVARAGVHVALHPREALERSAALAELIVRDELIGAPHTSLNVTIGSTRRFAVVNRPLDEFKAIRRAVGGSINDVVLAVCTTGLRHLLLGRGEQLQRRGLRAMVPMNVRQSSETLMLDNLISSLFVELPVTLHRGRERAASPDRRHDRAVEVVERRSRCGGDDRPGGPRPARRARSACTLALRDAPVQRDHHQRAGAADPAVRVRSAATRGPPSGSPRRCAFGGDRDLLLTTAWSRSV